MRIGTGSIRIGIGKRGGGMGSSAYWDSLISAAVENAAPTNVVLTFPTAKPSLGASDFTIAGFTISSASWTGAVLTLVTSVAIKSWDTVVVTFVTTGQTAAVTNNVITYYGIQIDTTATSPDQTRIASSVADMALHASLPIHNLIKGCLLADNGTVNYYLKADDWSKKADGAASNLDGTDGQVMMEWPAFYYKVDMDGGGAGKHQIKISLSALTGYTLVAKHYVSAFEAAIQRSTTKLASVINTSTDYRGGNNTSAWDAAANSLLGMACSYISRTDGRTAARNRGAGWNQYGYSDHTWMFWFYVIEFATLNSQKAVNAVLTAEGYKQGGLGAGTTTAVSATLNTFNTYNPFIPIGASNAFSNGSGEVTYQKISFGGAGVHVNFKVPRYRGHEHPFGHIWKTVDGINVEVQSVAGGGKTNTYVADNPADWNDANYTNYVNRGEQARADGFQKTALLGAKANFVPTISSGGSDSTYYCDYYYTNIPTTTTLRTLFVGGAADGASYAGFAFLNTAAAPSYASTIIGFRLCFKAV